LFYRAIKARHPEMNLIANEWGGVPTSAPVDIVDEHYYNSPEFFIAQANRYDSYPRTGPKVFVGEYAVTQGGGQGNLRAAVGEAAFMTGLERNADVVIMASYAPLFVNVNHKRWNPDLINFDSARVYGLPGYYVQLMFGENRGDVVLPLAIQLPTAAEPQARQGKIGLGTWLTQAEYKDIRVTKDGQLLYASDFSKGAEGWRPIRGDWRVQDGAYRQSANTDNVQAHAGDAAWSDYTYTIKARKLGGAEGFLVMFHVKDDQNWVWLNLGGWGNREHALELCEGGGKSIIGRQVPGQIETGRWYDVRVELKGQNIKGYLDGKLVQEASYPVAKPLHASASLARTAGEVVLKVVNASKQDQPTEISLRGATKVDTTAKVTVLASASPLDENSLAEPRKVAPVTRAIQIAGPLFQHQFPANSVTILRIKAQ
jgi:alpha-L-arabinofuranosidase